MGPREKKWVPQLWLVPASSLDERINVVEEMPGVAQSIDLRPKEQRPDKNKYHSNRVLYIRDRKSHWSKYFEPNNESQY